MRRAGEAPVWLLALIAIVVAGTAPLSGQTTAQPVLAVPIAPGDTVRVDAPPGVPFLIRARVVELRPSAIVIRINATSDTVVPFGEIRWLDVRRGSRGHAVVGTIAGLAAGVVAGGTIFTGKAKQHTGSTTSRYAIIGGAAGSVAGFIIGDFIRSDRWIPVVRGPSPVEDFGLLEPVGVSPIPLAQDAELWKIQLRVRDQ
jgi:hypothetical protein